MKRHPEVSNRAITDKLAATELGQAQKRAKEAEQAQDTLDKVKEKAAAVE
jgi:hypothetical protein